MKARDADQSDPEPAGHPPGRGHTDVIESGPDRPPRSPRGIAVGVVLVLTAAMAGYLLGSRHGADTAAPGAPSSPAAPAVAEPIANTSKRCSAQLADRLQLGIEIVNQSPTAATLRRMRAALPLPGLRATAMTWGSCGQLRPEAGGDDYLLPAGATAWLTITFDVLVACPGPIPVNFTVQYAQPGRSGTADLPGFADLGDVPYRSDRCPASS